MWVYIIDNEWIKSNWSKIIYVKVNINAIQKFIIIKYIKSNIYLPIEVILDPLTISHTHTHEYFLKIYIVIKTKSLSFSTWDCFLHLWKCSDYCLHTSKCAIVSLYTGLIAWLFVMVYMRNSYDACICILWLFSYRL